MCQQKTAANWKYFFGAGRIVGKGCGVRVSRFEKSAVKKLWAWGTVLNILYSKTVKMPQRYAICAMLYALNL
jgi:hypothetical protein